MCVGLDISVARGRTDRDGIGAETMFEGLGNRLGDIFGRIKRRGALSEAEIGTALREVRIALLEADVALPVVKDFVTRVKERAVGQEVLRSVTPGQQVIKIVHDNLIEMLGGEGHEAEAALNLKVSPPMMKSRSPTTTARE